MLNAKLNKKLHECRHNFGQYSQLTSNANNADIPKQYKNEVYQARINFLLFSLNSLIQAVSQHSIDRETQSLMRPNVENIQHLLSETDSKNPKQCIAQLEKAIEVWSQLCQ